MSTTSSAGTPGTTRDAAACGDWQVAPPLPADRGLVARLVEDSVRTDRDLAAMAPGVASGTQRAGAWLASARPVWSGVVAEPGRAPRRLLGYADVLAAPDRATPHRVRLLLLAPAAAGTPAADLLRSAAEEAVTALDAAASTAASGPLADEDEAPVTRFAVPVPVRRRPVAALAGAAAIALGGVAAVLAVQVGVGPLGGVLPFLGPGDPARTSLGGPGAGDPDTTASVPGQPVVDAGDPLAPLPAPAPGTDPGPGTTDPSGPGGPTTPPPGPPPAPPGDQPGLTSSLLDPVVSTVVTAVDGATGGAAAPVTSVVGSGADDVTDLLDEAVDGVVGLLPRSRR